MTTETVGTVETKETTVDPSIYDALITEDIDFRVETRGLHTTDTDGGMHMPDHEATIRINPDGSEAPLWVVGSRYEVVDHREIIKSFAKALDTAGLAAEVEHQVYRRGCRIYSFFIMDKSYPMGEGKPPARPYFTLTTSHDGALRLGFTVGAIVGGVRLNVSKTVYGAYAKHTKGINIEKTLKEIEKALTSFMEEVIPMWERMQSVAVNTDMVRKIIENAVNRKVISKHRAAGIATEMCGSLWDTYTAIVNEVSKVTGKRGTAERAFDRNTEVGEYFRRLASGDMEGLKKVLEPKKEEKAAE